MESEVNVKGAGLRELFKAYIEPDVPQEDPEELKTNSVWKRVLESLDKKARGLTNGGTQNKKAKSKTSLKGKVQIEDVSPAKKERTSNNLKSKSKGDKEIVD